eukprot:GFUD01032279.1.p1 GENE.GFUD01032279.1~~GFUD01032279.1.p1  ORF type:complete len:292 (+),score=82.86 GFUD01032279.1:192-1067(+)
MEDEVIVIDDFKNNNETKMVTSPFDSFVSKFDIGDRANQQENSRPRKADFNAVKEKEFANNNNSNTKNRNIFTKQSEGKDDNNIVSGGDLKTIEDYIALGVPRQVAVMKHPLEHPWAFWYFRNDKCLTWEQNQQNIATVDTIEDFWQVFNYIEPASKLGSGCDYSVFKKGIMPDWEDFQNMSGGRWLINSERNNRSEVLDNYWLETLFILIGEHAGEYASMVNGAVINIRNKGDKVAVWIRDANNMTGVMEIGRLVKSSLGLDTKIHFSVHREDSGRSRFGSQNSPSKIYV